jgi:iron complex outermembrane receptor protein
MRKLSALIGTASGIAMLGSAGPLMAQAGQPATPVSSASDAQTPVDGQAPPDAQPAASPAQPQEEIVVTGSRLREESVQDTPIAVSVLNNRTVEDLHATDITALTAIAPSLNISFNPTGNNVPLISLRGFAVVGTDISIEPGVSVYVDGIYQPTIAGGLAELFDTERVEVLRGPQSALLGKSSSAGAILVRRIRPTNDFNARFQAEYGTDNLVQLQGRVNVPIVDGVLSGLVYGLYRHRDDYVDNQYPGGRDLGGEDTFEIRGALRFTPSSSIDWYLTADYAHRRPSQSPVRNIAPDTFLPCTFYGLCTNDDGLRRVSNIDYSAQPRQRDFSATSELNVDFGGAKLTSLTGYRHFDFNNQADVDGTQFPLLNVFDQRTKSTSASQEVRLSSIENGGWDLGGRLAWLIGAYYNHANTSLVEPHDQFGGSLATPVVTNIAAQRAIRTGYAVFGHLDFDITDRLTVSFGARQSWDRVRHLYSLRAAGLVVPDPLPNSQARSDRNFSIEAGAQYKLTDRVMAYFRYAEGYRGGGFIGFPSSVAQAEGGYGPETSNSYEVGLRSEILDRRLLLNVTLFNTNFDNLQRSESISSPTAGFITVTSNIASARTRGVELEAVAHPIEGLEFRSAVSYLDAQYTDYTVNGADLTNTRFSYAPKWTVNFTPSYQFHIGDGVFDRLRLQASYEYKSTYLAAAQDVPQFTQPGYSIVDAQISLMGGRGHRYSVTAYVQNLFNQDYTTYGTFAAPLFYIIFDNPGRRFGLTAEIDF